MIVQEGFLKRIRSAFDLNIYEAKIWAALLSKGVATAGELSDISSVPRSRSYDVLESLEKRGFAIMKLGKPIRYIAIDPQEIVKRVKRGISSEADGRLNELEGVRSTSFFTDLELLFKHGIEHIDPTTISGTLKGRNAIYNHIESMVSGAQKSVIFLTSQNGFLRKSDAFGEILERLSKRGVLVRIATQLNTKETEKLSKDVQKYAQVKHAPNFHGRFVIIDGKEVLFMTTNDTETHESSDIGVWISSHYFASALEGLFDIHWKGI